MKTQITISESYPNRLLKLFLLLLLLGAWGFSQAQILVIGNNQIVTINSNTYYSSITVNNGGTLNVISPATLTVGLTGTTAGTQVVDFQNGSAVNLASGATLIVNGLLNNSNNSSGIIIDGTLTVNGNVTGGNGSTVTGSGTINSTGTITGAGNFFGNSNDCNTGPCNGNNLCNFTTANQIIASGNTTHCTTTNTTPILNGSTITSSTYQWQSSSSLTGTYTNVSPGVTTQNFTPPNNLTATIYYVRNATISSCTQTSNIITVKVGAAPLITAQPANSQTVCIGAPVSFTVSATGNVLMYQWRKNTTNIVGATNATYTINTVALADAAANYNCVVTSSSCTAPNTTTTSNSALVVTNANVPFATASTNATFCIGGNISLTGTATGGTGGLASTWTGPNSYATSGALSPIVATGTATALMAGTYTHAVTDANGCKASATTTNTSTPMLTMSASITSTPSSICAGASAVFNGTASNTGFPAPIAPLVYEDFNTNTTGALHNIGTGLGWSGNWDVQNGDVTVPGYNVASTASMTYSTLQTSGNYAVGGRAYLTAGRNIDVTNPALSTYISSGIIGASGTTVYMSALLKKEFNSDEELWLKFHNGGINWNPASNITGMGYFGASSNTSGIRYWSLLVNGSVIQTSIPVTFGSTALLVIKVTFGATNTINLYVNPSSIGSSEPAATISTSTTNAVGFRAVAFYAGNGTNQGSMDEMRIGTTYASATPQGPTYQWQLNGSNITGARSTTYNSGSLAASDAVRLVVTSTGSCLVSSTATSNTITVSNSNQWVGISSASWNTGANWCGGVPSSTIDVVIPSGTTFAPQITGVAANAKSITINSGATLTLLSGQSLNIYGNFTNNGTFTDNGGTTSYLGSAAQTALNITTVKNLTLNNASGLTLNCNTRVNGILTLTSGALTSNGRLTVSLTTGAIAPTGSGSVVGNMTVRRESSDFGTADLVANFHYVGSPLAGVQFSDIADNVAFTSTNFYGYNEGSGHTYIQQRWKSLVTGAFIKPPTTLMNAQLFTNGPTAMVGYALQFNNLPTTTEILDFTGTYTHGAGTSFTTGSMSYTNGGQAWGNGWQLLANPYPSYIDWRLVTTSNVALGITYYNSTTNNNADYIPASGSFGEASNNGGSPYIPAMQAYWVQVLPAGNGVVTVPNSARSISPVFTGYGTVPNFYREARPTAQSLRLMASNDKGSDETTVRFGEGATRQFDGKWDLFRTSPNSYIPTLSTETEKIEYCVNSLPVINVETSVDVNVEIASSGVYTLALKETMNMENYEAVNLYDRQTNVTQNLLLNDTYSFSAKEGDKKQRFAINFKPSTITNLNAASTTASVTISSNSIDVVNIQAKNAGANLADVSIINVLGQEVFRQNNIDLSSGIGTFRIENSIRGVYIVKAIIDGRTHTKEVFLGK